MSVPDDKDRRSSQLFAEVCFTCGRKLPEDPQPSTQAFDGYCDDACANGKNGVNSVSCLASEYGWDGQGDPYNFMSRTVYKDTDWGVCFAVHDDVGGVTVSGYVECVGAECPEHKLYFPFHIDDFKAAVEQCELDSTELSNEN